VAEVVEVGDDVDKVEALMKIVLGGQEAALRYQHQMFQTVLDANARVLEATTSRLQSLERQQQANLEAIQQLMTAEDDSGNQLLGSMLPALLQGVGNAKKVQ